MNAFELNSGSRFLGINRRSSKIGCNPCAVLVVFLKDLIGTAAIVVHFLVGISASFLDDCFRTLIKVTHDSAIYFINRGIGVRLVKDGIQ